MSKLSVSVIVPIYNIEDFVYKCVRSIQHQTVKDIEIILVDDGSTDRSGSICDDFAAADDRISVIHKPNGGLSDARNVGIRAASGELITLIDGDDYVTANYVENLIRPFGDSNVDVAISRFKRVLPGTEAENNGGEYIPYTVLPRDESLLRLFYQKGITTSAWGKMYRSTLFDGVSYPVGEIHEDLPVTYRLLSKSRMIAAVDSEDYFYVQHPNSITAQKNIVRRLPALGFANEAVNYFEGEDELETAARTRVFMEAVYIVSQISSFEELKLLDPAVIVAIRENRSAVVKGQAQYPQKALALVSLLGAPGIWVLMKVRERQNQLRLSK